MNALAARLIAVIALVVLGLGGLYLNIEYSGWVLFIGLLTLVFS